MKILLYWPFIALLAAPMAAPAQQCASGEVRTAEPYLYGRFETGMQSAPGNGIVSSFFQYNVDLGCNWPAENNEIDIEMTGNLDDSVQFTTHYPGPWSVTQIVPTPFDPHAGMHVYAFEWEPGIVRWFADGVLLFTQDASHANNLVHPMRIFMNLWAAGFPDWVGPWDPAILPRHSYYDFVRYYAWTPGTGNAGTNDNFTLQWEDNFDSLDTGRWEITEFGGFDNNYCTFVSNNVEVSGGKLRLSVTAPLSSTNSPVDFSVDASSLNLLPADVIYLNGTFNNWCGTCNPMADTDGDGIWELTITLPAGKHEYLYTKNGWSDIGGAPVGSSCDFVPCDEYGNYGVTVPIGAGSVQTETYCWAGCGSCAPDQDGDGVTDESDNCVAVANSEQSDGDDDGIGDLCDVELEIAYAPGSVEQGDFLWWDGLSPTNGQPPYTFSLVGGWLSWPLTLNPDSGIVMGIPQELGTSYFTIRVADVNGNFATVQSQISVTEPASVCGSCHGAGL